MNEEKKYLKGLTANVLKCLKAIDAEYAQEMKRQESAERGRRIAAICNCLEFYNDQAMRFGLGYGFKKINRMKK